MFAKEKKQNIFKNLSTLRAKWEGIGSPEPFLWIYHRGKVTPPSLAFSPISLRAVIMSCQEL